MSKTAVSGGMSGVHSLKKNTIRNGDYGLICIN